MRFFTAISVLLFAGVVFAVTPAVWQHNTEADFSEGEFDLTVVTSLGQIRLSGEVKILMPAASAPPVVSAVAVADEVIYAASGTDPVIYKIADGEAEKFAEVPGAMVATLLRTGKKLLAGTGGKDAGIYVIDKKGRPKPLWTDPKVKYVWAIVPGPKGSFYAATGPEAKVFSVSSDGEGQVIYQAGKLAKNILCLARSQEGLLYAGTDEKGLVIEIDPVAESSRVLLDADEKEIAAIIPDGAGGLYVGTSDAAGV